MVFTHNKPEYRELTLNRPIVQINLDELQTNIPDLLDEVFRIGSTYAYDEQTSKNIYFYMDPLTHQFIAGNIPDNSQERENLKEIYLTLLEQTFAQTDGYLYITEEIFGIDSTKRGGYGVRSDMTSTELKHKLLNRVPINRPLTLCTLQIDEIIPKILIIEPITH